jgi:hypothetical protein
MFNGISIAELISECQYKELVFLKIWYLDMGYRLTRVRDNSITNVISTPNSFLIIWLMRPFKHGRLTKSFKHSSEVRKYILTHDLPAV